MIDNPKCVQDNARLPRDVYGYLPQSEPTIVGFWQDQNHSLSLEALSFRGISKDAVEILIVVHPASRIT